MLSCKHIKPTVKHLALLFNFGNSFMFQFLYSMVEVGLMSEGRFINLE